jgi:GNAT superfamily N-acetyltransferase
VATATDIPALTSLWAMALEELAGQRGGELLARGLTLPGVPEEALAIILGDINRLLVLGTMDSVEAGFASVRCQPTAGGESCPVAFIDAIYVEPWARQVGVGEAMVDLAISWCTERGCRGVDAPALPGSRPAKAFFEDHDFVTRLLVMHRPLPGPRPGAHG